MKLKKDKYKKASLKNIPLLMFAVEPCQPNHDKLNPLAIKRPRITQCPAFIRPYIIWAGWYTLTPL